MKRLNLLIFVTAAQIACATMDPPKGDDAWRQIPGTPVLWQDRGSVGNLDLYWGMGSAERAPKPPFTFIEEDVTGTNPKLKVRDANNVEWTVKFAGTEPHKNEVHAEVAATRLVWALGYLAEENYFIPTGKIDKVAGLKRARVCKILQVALSRDL